MDLEKVFDLAKVDLFAKQNAFICSVFCSLKHSWDSSFPTAATDGTSLKINPDFFMGLSRPMRVTVLAHETWHVVLKHMTRRGHREPQVWNWACDYAINNMLAEHGYIFEEGLVAPIYKDMSAEQIYEELIKSGKQPKKSLGNDLVLPPSGQQQQQVEQQVDSILIRATMAAKAAGQAGNIPGSVSAYLQDLLYPKLPWNVILFNYVNEMTKNDYSWSKPNKRFMPQVYLPTLNDTGLDHIVFFTDISGSVTDEQFTVYISEIAAIKEQLKPKKLTIVTFDTRIQDVHELEDEDDIRRLQFTGRGGTSLVCVSKWIEEHKPNLAVVFSDLDCSPMENKPSSDLIWVCLDNPGKTVPFGHLIHVAS